MPQERRAVFQTAAVKDRIPVQLEGGTPQGVKRAWPVEVTVEGKCFESMPTGECEKIVIAEVIEGEEPAPKPSTCMPAA